MRETRAAKLEETHMQLRETLPNTLKDGCGLWVKIGGGIAGPIKTNGMDYYGAQPTRVPGYARSRLHRRRCNPKTPGLPKASGYVRHSVHERLMGYTPGN